MPGMVQRAPKLQFGNYSTRYSGLRSMFKKIIFFLDEFHHGAVNHVIHAAGFTILGYGLGIQNWWIVVLSPFIMEAGHLYNYATGRHRKFAIRIIPLQIVAWLIFVALGYLFTRIFLTP